MTLPEINSWLSQYARDYAQAGISPEQAVALCRWKLSDKVDCAVDSCLFADDPVAAFEDLLPKWPFGIPEGSSSNP